MSKNKDAATTTTSIGIRQAVLNTLKNPFAGQGLTDQQEQAVTLVAYGYTAKEVGEKLGIKEQAAKDRIHRARKVLGIKASRELTQRLIAKVHKLVTDERHE